MHIGGRKEKSEHRNKKKIKGRNTIKNSESNIPKTFIVGYNVLPAKYFKQNGIPVNEPLFRWRASLVS